MSYTHECKNDEITYFKVDENLIGILPDTYLGNVLEMNGLNFYGRLKSQYIIRGCSIIKRKLSERDLSREWLCMKTLKLNARFLFQNHIEFSQNLK